MSDRRPTLRDVASRAGVSEATVSLVLNGRHASRGRVGEATRARVLSAAGDLGYERNQLARSLRRGRTEQISVITKLPDSPWAQTLIADVARVGEVHGYSTVVFVSGDWREHLRRRTSDGAVVDLSGDGDPDLSDLQQAIDGGLALVVLNSWLEPDRFDVVRVDEYEACGQAIRFLLDQGRRRIACLRQFVPRPPHLVCTRYQCYRDTHDAYGLAVDESLVRNVYASRERAYAATLDLLSGNDPPDAIFATSDLAAISALWAANRVGAHVPEDIAIIGAGNATEGAHTEPPLTTVGPPRVDFTAAAQLLFDRLAGHAHDSGRVLPQRWELIHRGTT